MSWNSPKERIEGSLILSIALDEIERLALSFGMSPSSKIGQTKDISFILPWIIIWGCREIYFNSSMSWISPREWIDGSPILFISLDEIQRLALSFGISPSSKIGQTKDMSFILPWMSSGDIERCFNPSISWILYREWIEGSRIPSISLHEIYGMPFSVCSSSKVSKIKGMSFILPSISCWDIEGIFSPPRVILVHELRKFPVLFRLQILSREVVQTQAHHD